MNDDSKHPRGDTAATRFSLSRWSERKRAVARGEAIADAPAVPAVSAASAEAAMAAPGATTLPAALDKPLPDVASLTFDSDFSVFMNGNVDASVKRAALRTLLHDPRFNVMDGLDVYIDDYSIPDPISPEVLAQLRHSIAVLNPVFPPDESVVAPPSIDDATPAQPPDVSIAAVENRAAAVPAEGLSAATVESVAEAAVVHENHSGVDGARKP
ncbi:MAG: DUF3306 domain-containing protein [Betaproteobacteria bacterium]